MTCRQLRLSTLRSAMGRFTTVASRRVRFGRVMSGARNSYMVTGRTAASWATKGTDEDTSTCSRGALARMRRVAQADW